MSSEVSLRFITNKLIPAVIHMKMNAFDIFLPPPIRSQRTYSKSISLLSEEYSA